MLIDTQKLKTAIYDYYNKKSEQENANVFRDYRNIEINAIEQVEFLMRKKYRNLIK